MSMPAESAVDNHGRVARIVSLSLVALYALVALGWAASAPDAEAVPTTPTEQVHSAAE